jgi:phosphotransferase system HPr-like phosphotransfer protein
VLKNLFLIALLATLGFLAWRHFTATPPPPTPEQEVAALVGQSVMPAGELAALCAKYPKLVTKELKGKTVSVSGLLHMAMVSGIKSNDLALEFAGNQQLKFMFRSDFGKKERWGGPAGMRFQKKGKEILGISVEKDTPADSETKGGDQIYSQIDTSSEEAALQSIVGKIANAYKGAKSPGGSKPAADKIVERVVCREGETITLRGEFRHIAPGWVYFDLVALP